MYCSGCGTQLQADLNYCNRCGHPVAAGLESERASIAESLSSSLGYVGGFGFLSFVFLVLVLVKNGIPGNQIIPIAFFYFAALFGICFLILRQTELLSGKISFRRRVDPAVGEIHPYTRPVDTNPLRELREPAVGSVIDETTHTLDKARVERR